MTYRTNDVLSKWLDRANGTRANDNRANGNRADVVAARGQKTQQAIKHIQKTNNRRHRKKRQREKRKQGSKDKIQTRHQTKNKKNKQYDILPGLEKTEKKRTGWRGAGLNEGLPV